MAIMIIKETKMRSTASQQHSTAATAADNTAPMIVGDWNKSIKAIKLNHSNE